MKKCYYKVTDIQIKMDRKRFGVLTHVANRKGLLEMAVRSYIAEHITARYDYEPIAQPLDELELVDQPYELGLSDALSLTANREVVVLHIDLGCPTDFVVAFNMPEHYNPLTNNGGMFTDEELRAFIQEELDMYLPITIKTTEVK